MGLLALYREMDRRGFRATRFDGYEMRYVASAPIDDLVPAMRAHRVPLIVTYAGRANLPPSEIAMAVGYRLGFPAYAVLIGAGEEEWRTFMQFAGVADLADVIDYALGWLPRPAAAGRAA